MSSHRAEVLPKLVRRLKLDGPNPRTISFTRAELEAIRQKANDGIARAEAGIKRNVLRHIVEAIAKAIESSKDVGPIPASERLYLFKITLRESASPIRRRIQVKDGTRDKLHEHIQTAMGWTNSHLHQFEIEGERYGDPEFLDDGFDDFHCIEFTVTKISEIVPQDGKRFRFLYEYDFGDGWQHEVLFEGCIRAEKGRRYPLCIAGERACPPEDVGGIWGYEEFLDVLADPKHEQPKDYRQWAGPFDPDAFDPGKATKAMRRELPDWRLW